MPEPKVEKRGWVVLFLRVPFGLKERLREEAFYRRQDMNTIANEALELWIKTEDAKEAGNDE